MAENHDDFIDQVRLAELRKMTRVNWDPVRLIRLCEELNESYRAGSFHAVAALTRAVMDHVPPIFGCANFTEVANNYAGGKSFRDAMKFLDGSARKISDAHLHTQARDREVLPTRMQVEVRPALDLLLAEVVRVSQVGAQRIAALEAKLERANDVIPEILCPTCQSIIARVDVRNVSHVYEEGEIDDCWEEIVYECGRETHNGKEVCPCGWSRKGAP